MTKYSMLAAMLTLAACSDYIDDVPVTGNEFCPVRLSLSLAPQTDGTPGVAAPSTRGVVDTDTGSPTDALDGSTNSIKNVWVLQYDGTDDNARIVGISRDSYIDDYDSTDPDRSTVKLVASSAPNTIVILANTFVPEMTFPSGSTLGELKTRPKWNF